ncbi:MAG: SemiSWEET transporter [Candidatus Eisenbacteria bacterium]|nr:SemiSWEET transporter [Candidatus Eisenbacteria bacterium]
MKLVSLLGLVAAACTTLAYVPQVVRTLRTRSTGDISLGMFVVMTTGVFLWLVYGVLIRDLPLIAANTVTFLFSLTLLVLKLRSG